MKNDPGFTLLRRSASGAACCGLVLMIVLCALRTDAQSTWEKMKENVLQQQCQQGLQKSCQALASIRQKQSQQSGQPSQAQSGQPMQQSASGAATNAAVPAGAAGWSDDCCGPEAMKKYAADASVLDIVGIKLGMTPQQAIAAVRAHNPGLKIDIIKAPIEHPSANSMYVNDSKVPVEHFPQYIYAHTAAISPNQGQVENITIRLTTPPNTPVVAAVGRMIMFHVGEPVMASNLLESLHKKYGIENHSMGDETYWFYDSNGKLLARAPNSSCMPRLIAGPMDPTRETIAVNWLNTSDNNGNGSYEYTSSCMAYLYTVAMGVGPNISPNSKIMQIKTAISSGALLAGSTRATHLWLQGAAEAKAKQQQNDADQRSAPPF